MRYPAGATSAMCRQPRELDEHAVGNCSQEVLADRCTILWKKPKAQPRSRSRQQPFPCSPARPSRRAPSTEIESRKLSPVTRLIFTFKSKKVLGIDVGQEECEGPDIAPAAAISRHEDRRRPERSDQEVHKDEQLQRSAPRTDGQVEGSLHEDPLSQGSTKVKRGRLGEGSPQTVNSLSAPRRKL